MKPTTASIQLLTRVLLFYSVRECFAFAKSLQDNPPSKTWRQRMAAQTTGKSCQQTVILPKSPTTG